MSDTTTPPVMAGYGTCDKCGTTCTATTADRLCQRCATEAQ